MDQKEKKQMQRAIKQFSAAQIPTYNPPQTVEKVMRPGGVRVKAPTMVIKEEDDKNDFVKRRREHQLEEERKAAAAKQKREEEKKERQKLLESRGVKTIIPAEPIRPKTIDTGAKKQIVESRRVVKVVRSGQMGPTLKQNPQQLKQKRPQHPQQPQQPQQQRPQQKQEKPAIIDLPTKYMKFKERTAEEQAKDLTAKRPYALPFTHMILPDNGEKSGEKRERESESKEASKIDSLFEEIEAGEEIALVQSDEKRTKTQEIEDAKEIDALFEEFEEKRTSIIEEFEVKKEEKKGGGKRKNKKIHLL